MEKCEAIKNLLLLSSNSDQSYHTNITALVAYYNCVKNTKKTDGIDMQKTHQ